MVQETGRARGRIRLREEDEHAGGEGMAVGCEGFRHKEGKEDGIIISVEGMRSRRARLPACLPLCTALLSPHASTFPSSLRGAPFSLRAIK